MNIVIEFLTTYWQQLFDAVILIISVVICLIRKKPSFNEIDSIKQDVLGILPFFINSVEKPGEGARKKSTVIDLCCVYITNKYKLTEIDGSLLTYIEDAIESILSTPTKKGE